MTTINERWQLGWEQAWLLPVAPLFSLFQSDGNHSAGKWGRWRHLQITLLRRESVWMVISIISSNTERSEHHCKKYVLNYLREYWLFWWLDLSILFLFFGKLYVPVHPTQTEGIKMKKSFLELNSLEFSFLIERSRTEGGNFLLKINKRALSPALCS